MARQRQVVRVRQDQPFKGRQFTDEVILWAVRWYLMFPISYRDLELMLLDRGVEVDHTTIFRWIQAYAAELEKRIRPYLRLSNGSWRVDETYFLLYGQSKTHYFCQNSVIIDPVIRLGGVDWRVLTDDRAVTARLRKHTVFPDAARSRMPPTSSGPEPD